jgi:two-component system chemotaxis sensor kinase CheA
MNEVVREFLLETHENLAQLDLDLVTLEKEPTERETLARVFRTLHTIKGTAGFLGFPRLQAVSHAAENLLSSLRSGELVFNPEIASSLLAVVDAIRRSLAAIEQTESEGEDDCSALIQTLDRLRHRASRTTQVGTVQPMNIIVPAAPLEPAPAERASPGAASVTASAPPSAPPAPPKPAPIERAGPGATSRTSSAPEPAPPAPPQSAPAERARPGSVSLAGSAPLSPSQAGIAAPPALDAGEPRTSAVSDTAIRVDVGLLDKLMTLVGELVLARNQIMQFSTSQEDAAFLGTVQRLNLLTTELQASVMKTRMQPIGNIWNKFPRVVRDLALACDKQVRLSLDGQETELDKTIVEAIRDPLTHLVRNAIDHGIERPGQREAEGKPAEGRLALHAFHEGGKVIIEIADDGSGIDPQRVRARAVQANAVTTEQAARMSDEEALNLIFLPGFSTAEKVTQFSGRGVGMDVVRTNIEKIGGTVDIDSRVGRGTTVKMKIPLTLAIIPALTITSGGDRYAIPQVSLLELVRLEGEQAQRGIEQIHGAPVYRLRGNLLPLVYLDRVLQVESQRPAHGEINIVVLQADDRQFGLVVDAIHDTEEIVVKPLQKQVKGLSCFAGATIMGDGTVALILDVLGVAQRAHVVTAVRERALADKAPVAEASADRQTVLLFSAQDGGRMAIPLAQVARLEEFPRSALERVGARHVVQYREEILPLINVARALRPGRGRNGRANGQRPRPPAGEPPAAGAAAAHGDDTVQVVVYAGQGRRAGLVVGSILDIVEETLASRARATRPGVLFTAVVQGRVTEFLDVEGIIRAADPGFFDQPHPVSAEV